MNNDEVGWTQSRGTQSHLYPPLQETINIVGFGKLSKPAL